MSDELSRPVLHRATRILEASRDRVARENDRAKKRLARGLEISHDEQIIEQIRKLARDVTKKSTDDR